MSARREKTGSAAIGVFSRVLASEGYPEPDRLAAVVARKLGVRGYIITPKKPEPVVVGTVRSTSDGDHVFNGIDWTKIPCG